MSAKFISSLTDENPDLRKQIGCMKGIFHLFDRHHFLASRRMSSHNHKRLLQGASHDMDLKYTMKTTKEKNLKTVPKEKPRVSNELYQASDSFSSGSFNGCNKTAQQKAVSSNQSDIRETPSETIIMKEQKTSFPDIVKDSMYREARGLSIKSEVKDRRRGHKVKHIDSPRPLHSLSGLQEGTKSSKNERLALPRLSYDERESRDALKSKLNLREFPRLSLDSKASSIKSSSLEPRCNFPSQDLHVENEKSSLVLNHEEGSNKRLSNVVAKLMGLEAFPNTMSADESTMIKIKSCLIDGSVQRSSKAANEGQPSKISCLPDVSRKEPASPRLRIANPANKSISKPRFPLEAAPWKEQDTSRGSEKRAPKGRKASTDTDISNMSSSVYSEIEKRITELEFKKSGKDLRALKRILEAMQKTRHRLENQNDESEFASQTSISSLEIRSSNQDSRLSMWKDQQNVRQFPTRRGTIPIKRSESSMETMKPAKVIDKVRISRSSSVSTMGISHLQTLRQRDSTLNRENLVRKQTTKDLMRRGKNLKDHSRVLPSIDQKNNSRGLEVDQTSKSAPQIKVENISTCGRSLGMLSPRSQQKKHGTGRQSHPTTPSSDSGRVRNPCGKQFKGLGYSNRKLKPKSTNLYQGDTASVKSESNNSLDSQIETEVTSLVQLIEMNDEQHKEPKLRNPEARFEECMPPRVELAATTLEQPSPVSVLDATFYGDESPSPVKKISTTFKEDDSPSPDEEEWHLENSNHLPYGSRSSNKHSHRKLEDIEHLAYILRLLNTTPDGVATYHTPSVNGNSNPDQQYITKILLASGLLRDVSYIPIAANQLHSPYNVINPNLFHVLEQTEERIELADEEFNEVNTWLNINQKMHRKIVFDTVNEILVHNFSSEGLIMSGRKRPNQQELLKEVQIEVDRLQRKPGCSLDDEFDGLDRIITADMMHRSADWENYIGEIPALVLDIERLIFKDLRISRHFRAHLTFLSVLCIMGLPKLKHDY